MAVWCDQVPPFAEDSLEREEGAYHDPPGRNDCTAG